MPHLKFKLRFTLAILFLLALQQPLYSHKILMLKTKAQFEPKILKLKVPFD
jgi:hypothetical protein